MYNVGVQSIYKITLYKLIINNNNINAYIIKDLLTTWQGHLFLAAIEPRSKHWYISSSSIAPIISCLFASLNSKKMWKISDKSFWLHQYMYPWEPALSSGWNALLSLLWVAGVITDPGSYISWAGIDLGTLDIGAQTSLFV
jgi:hypothetical protein